MSSIEVKVPDKKRRDWRWWRRIPWTTRNRVIAGLLGVLLIVLSVGLVWGQLFPERETATVTPSPTPSATPAPKDQPNPLNGTLYTAREAAVFAQRRPMAVMVENHVLARPQSGLQDAEVIYEAMAEGGITRFMALYLAHQPEKIGPVRSARLHFASWAAEYDAAYAHWGGSTESLAYLQSHNRPVNLDQFQHAGAFWRDYSGGKPLEHTGYTSVTRLRKVLAGMSREAAPHFEQWRFKDDALVEDRPTSQTVTLGFLGTFGYAAQFAYRSQTNDYVRSTGGKAHVDANGEQLTAKTIVLLYQPVRSFRDANGHPAVDVETIGQGDAVVIEDGVAVTGRWHKASMNARTQLTDVGGAPLALTRGKLWVISVPVGSKVTF